MTVETIYIIYNIIYIYIHLATKLLRYGYIFKPMVLCVDVFAI